MSQEMETDSGYAPWEPLPGAKLTHVLHRYDVPLIGIFWGDGQSHLFWCAEGEVSDVSVWGYSTLEDADVKLLDSADDLDAALDEVRAGRPYWVGVSSENEGLLGVVDGGLYETPGDALRVAEREFPQLGRTLQRFHVAPRSA